MSSACKLSKVLDRPMNTSGDVNKSLIPVAPSGDWLGVYFYIAYFVLFSPNGVLSPLLE
jgi:hypothetical protein